MHLSEQVKAVMLAEDITPQTLEEMVSRAALTTQRGANRRYYHWFMVYNAEEDKLEKLFQHLDCHAHLSRWVKHQACEGRGCPECLWSGEVPE